MRRIAVVVMVVVFSITAAPSSAWAASLASTRTLQLTGRFDGHSVSTPGEPCGGVVHLDYAGTFHLDKRAEHNGYYVMDICITFDRERIWWTLSGPFVITSARGVVLRGTVDGSTNLEDVAMTLTVTESSGDRYPIRGTIEVDTTYGGLYSDAHRGTFSAALDYVR
jgi:hypothetical protein